MTKQDSPPRIVRARALVHMKRLLATSAAAMAVGETACHRGERASDAGADATAFGPPAAGGDAGATVSTNDTPDANVVVSERNHGYAVVDPMPRPVHCPEVGPRIKATATKSGKNVVLRVDNAGGYAGFKYEQNQFPTAYYGTYVKHAIDAKGTMVITIEPDENGNAGIAVKGTCGTGVATINVFVGRNMIPSVHEY